jgi:hypothetical protein
MKLPFGYLPGHWGLAGKTREVAQAEYELTGFELEKRLLEIKKDELSDKDYAHKRLELDHKFKLITVPEYHRAIALLMDDGPQKQLALLELDYREGKIKELEYEKTVATIKDEPWVIVLNMDFSGKGSLEGSFELDWNEQFVKKLEAEGYSGITPDVIVNQWFMEVCRNVAMEEFDGTGDFTSNSEANLDAVKRWSSTAQPVDKKRKGYS